MSILSKGSGKKQSTTKPGKNFSGNKMWFLFALVPAIAAAGILFVILYQLVATTTYYVLDRDVPARSQITADMLTEVVASKGSEPRNALGLEDVSYSEVYAKYALNTGDIITASNTGDLIPLHQGIPEDFVVASFVADASNAVAGKLATGNYIDIIANDESTQSAKYALRHVLLLDVSSDPNSIGESEVVVEGEGAATSTQDQMRSGIPTLYTIALPQEDAAILALIRDHNLLVVLSPKSADEKFESGNIKATLEDVYGDRPVGDSGRGTDPLLGQGEDVAVAEEGSDADSSEESASPSPSPSDSPSSESTEE